METLNASAAKREFGEVLLKAQKEPVGISRNGKPVAVVVSAEEYAQWEALKADWLKAKIQEGMTSLKNGDVREGDKVINELRQKIRDASL
jgi:prevent-host-death family protein